MRNSCPFNILKLIYYSALVVLLVELSVERVKSLCGERLTRHIHIVSLALELSKECLTEDSGAEALKEVVEDVSTALLVGLNAEKVLSQKHLVDGGRYLCYHNSVVVVYVILRLVREVGVHRMSELVSESVSVVKSVGVVEKNVGVNAENSAGECARGLALVLVNVYPVLRIRAVKKLLICLSERKGCLLYKLLALLKADLHIDILNDRTVEVVHMKLVKTESLLSDLEIALHRGDTVVYGVAEAVIYRYGNVICKERRLAGICIASYVGEKCVHLYGTRIGSGKGVDILLELTEVRLKGILSYSYVAALAEYTEVAVCESYVLAVLVLDGREGHINALKHLKRVLASASRIREHSHHSLLIGRKHVLLGAKHIVKLMSVGRKSFLFVEVGTEKLLACGEYLGFNEGY